MKILLTGQPISVERAQRVAKEIAVRAWEHEKAFVLENALFQQVRNSEDAQEGPRSYIEKRAAVCKGRRRRSRLRARAVREVDALSGAASDLQGRSVLLHDAAALLAHVGEEDRAMALLREAIDSGGFDYYWMADLAGIAERLGRVDEALAWRERAWHAARGPATRVQWGARWLDALLRLRPQDDVAITATVEALFDELGKQPAALSGRNRSALTAIATPLGDWAAGGARAGVLARARDRLAALCRRDCAADAAEFARCTVILGT